MPRNLALVRVAAAAGLQTRRHAARADGRWPCGHQDGQARPRSAPGLRRATRRRTRRGRTQALARVRRPGGSMKNVEPIGGDESGRD